MEEKFAPIKFIQDNKLYFLIATTIFLLFTIIGFALPIFFKEKILEMIAQMADFTKGKNLIQIIFLIFFNNVKVSFFSIILGLGLGVFPIVIAAINGYLLGFVSRGVANSEGPSVLWKLLPHGIFEFPAIIFSIGIGLKLGLSLLQKDPKKHLKKNIIEALKFFAIFIIPILLIAATIEGLLITLI